MINVRLSMTQLWRKEKAASQAVILVIRQFFGIDRRTNNTVCTLE